MPARPIRIYLVRHAQSEANLDKAVNARLPDYRVELSANGKEQSAAVGAYLAQTLATAKRIRIFCSPYVRNRRGSADGEDPANPVHVRPPKMARGGPIIEAA